MSKLSSKQVQDILERHANGESVSLLARENCVTKMVVYYHVKTKGARKTTAPKCLKDYQMNEIVRLEEKLRNNPHLEKHIKREIVRMRMAMGIRLDKCSDDPFVLQ